MGQPITFINYFRRIEMRSYHTQMEAAKQGVLTPEMQTVAKKEGVAPEKLMEWVACGQVAIPANINHKSLSAEGIGTCLLYTSPSPRDRG